jgi:hypothetical protein
MARRRKELSLLAGVALAVAAAGGDALAGDPDAPLGAGTTPVQAGHGLAVLALDGASAAAWPFAHDVYASPALHNASVDEAHARVLAGERPSAAAPQELRDFADTCAAVKGDDAPSRALLASIAQRFQLRGVLVVARPADGSPQARLYLADTAAFESVIYLPDSPAATSWTGAVQSLLRTTPPPPAPSLAAPVFSARAPAQPAAPPTRLAAPSAALREGPRIENAPPRSTPFYESAWFWGAIGAAAFAGGAVYFATRDNTPSTIHLQMQVPR